MSAAADRAWAALAEVADPEMPMVSVVDLGIVRDVQVDGDTVRVALTPTYSGCPALQVIEDEVRAALAAAFARVEVRTELAPPWSTDAITPDGRRKLAAAGVAPPGARLLPLLGSDRPERCPRCGAVEVEELATFGGTACKALWRCLACREPFDYVKPH